MTGDPTAQVILILNDGKIQVDICHQHMLHIIVCCSSSVRDLNVSDESADEQAPLLNANSTRQSYTVENYRDISTMEDNNDHDNHRSHPGLYRARTVTSYRERSARLHPLRRTIGRNRYQRIEGENIGGREEDEGSTRR